MSTPQWITDRAPTRDDADVNSRVEIARSPGGDSSVQVNWKMVAVGTRWRPTKHWRAPQVEQMPIDTTTTETCGACRFYLGTDPDVGICRRRPPVRAGWPETTPADWCGEWQARK